MPTPTVTLRISADDQPLVREVVARLKGDPAFRSNLQELVQDRARAIPAQPPAERLAEVVDRLASIADRLAAVPPEPATPSRATGRRPVQPSAGTVDPAAPDHVRFRQLREVLGMRQEDAAALFERARPTVAYWENPTEGRPTVPHYALVLLELLIALAPADREAVLAGSPVSDADVSMAVTEGESVTNDMDEGQRLARRRRALKLRQVDLGVFGGASAEAVAHWERGRRPVPAWAWSVLDLLEGRSAARVEDAVVRARRRARIGSA